MIFRCRASTAAVALVSQLLSFAIPVVGPHRAWAAASDDILKQAQNHYDEVRFEQAIALLTPAIDGNTLVGDDLVRGLEIVARCEVKLGRTIKARETFKAILRLNPAYVPDAIRIPPDEIAVFDQARLETGAAPTAQPEATRKPAAISNPEAGPPIRKKSKKLWYILGGVVAAGVLAGVAASGGGEGGKSSTSDRTLGFPPPPTP